jgi:peroxiredoxin
MTPQAALLKRAHSAMQTVSLQKRGIVVLGVSADDVKSHQKFADKYGLNFPLLADTDTHVSQLYDVWKEKNFAGNPHSAVSARGIIDFFIKWP